MPCLIRGKVCFFVGVNKTQALTGSQQLQCHLFDLGNSNITANHGEFEFAKLQQHSKSSDSLTSSHDMRHLNFLPVCTCIHI